MLGLLKSDKIRLMERIVWILVVIVFIWLGVWLWFYRPTGPLEKTDEPSYAPNVSSIIPQTSLDIEGKG